MAQFRLIGSKLSYFERDSGGTSRANYETTTAVFRDPTAWYHIVFVYNTTVPSLTIYVNGVSQTLTAFTALSLNYDGLINTTVRHEIGSEEVSTNFLSGYMTEIHFIDGQALDPSYFGQTSTTTGAWDPKKYTGTYGTNGFYLKFADNSNTTAATLGKDSSGNGNNWTPNNFSVTAGAGNDSMTDTPTNYGTNTGVGGEVRGNFATLNPLKKASAVTLSNGNLDVSTSFQRPAYSTIGVGGGKWYWEWTSGGADAAVGVGVDDGDLNANQDNVGSHVGQLIYNGYDGNKINAGSSSAYAGAYTTGDVIGVALNMDAGELAFYKNGVSLGTAFTGLSGVKFPTFFAAGGTSGTANFGQRPFTYPAPEGFKALNTQNLPTPAIRKPSLFFTSKLYTGTGAALTISGVNFSPDLVWIKSRSASADHALYDTSRGVQARLESNTHDPEATGDNGVTAFNSDGLTLGTLAQVNTSSATYVAWCWEESVGAGFDIVLYTGNGSNRTVDHGIGSTPYLIVVKRRSATSHSWGVYHASTGNTGYLRLNDTLAFTADSTYWNNTSPTSSNFSLGTSSNVNESAATYVAYLWAPVAGFSFFGSYTGNGNADGPVIAMGFLPAFGLIKCATTAATDWDIFDDSRSTYNPRDAILQADSPAGESGFASQPVDFLAVGMKVRTTIGNVNTSASTHVGAWFAETPFKYARAV